MDDYIQSIELYLIKHRITKIEMCKMLGCSLNLFWKVRTKKLPPSAKFMLAMQRVTNDEIKADFNLIK